MESLKWLFELRDMLSGPARAMRSAIGDLDQSLKAAKGPLEELQSSLSSATARGVFFGSFVGGIAKQLGGVFLHVVSSAAREVTHLAYAFGKATIGNADLADRMQISLGVMLGFGNAAKKLMSDVVHQAASLPITTQEALGATTAYITGGFGAKEIPKLLTATADVGALNPTHSEEARGVFVDELRRLKQEGFLNERLMFLLPQVVGISGQKIYENLKRLTGAGSVEDVRKLIGQRAIDSDTGIKAILAALRDMEGGALGNLSHQLAHTFTGLLSTLRSRFFEMTEGLADSPAFASLKGVLENLTSLTDTTTAAGRRMMSVIGNAFDAMFGWLKRFSGAAGMERGPLRYHEHIRAQRVQLALYGVLHHAHRGGDRNYGEHPDYDTQQSQNRSQFIRANGREGHHETLRPFGQHESSIHISTPPPGRASMP